MAMEIGFKKWNKGRMSGLPTGSPRAAHVLCFGTVKIVPSLCEMDQKRPCVGCLKLMK